MTDTTKPRPRRTFSAFGDVRRMPSEYEIVTQGQNWTTRENRTSAFEANPSTPPNLWFRTYRDNTPLHADDWEKFREPDSLTYQAYVKQQAESQSRVDGVLEEYAKLGSDSLLPDAWLGALAAVYTPSRYLFHGLQQVQAYIGYLAPTSYVTNPAALSTADYLRRVTTIAYRTRELQIAHPGLGFGTDQERHRWEDAAEWQPARTVIEHALVSYDWGEALVATNLVIAPTIDALLNERFGESARLNGDHVDWLISGFLHDDNDRRTRWSVAAARFAVAEHTGSRDAVKKWFAKWAPLADDAAAGLAPTLADAAGPSVSAAQIMTTAAEARERVLAEVLA